MRRLRRLLIVAVVGFLLYQGSLTGAFDAGMQQSKFILVRRTIGAMEWHGAHPALTATVHTGATQLYTWLWNHSTDQERTIIRRYRALRDGVSPSSAAGAGLTWAERQARSGA